MTEFKLAEEFSECVGGRYKSHGPKSGEELRDDHLIPKLCEAEDGLVVNLDGVMGLPPSFAEEAFGGLVRRLGPSVLDRIKFISTELPERIPEIEGFMRDAVDYYDG